MTKVNFPILTFNEAGIQIIDGDRGFAYPKSSDFMESGYCLFLTAKNVTSDGFKFNEGKFISEKKHGELRNGVMQRQDIVLTSRGTVGNVALYDDQIPYNVLRINSGMLILRNSGKLFETDYLYALLRSPLFRKQIRRLSFGSAQHQITVQVTNGFEFPCPSNPEQKKIAEILLTWDRAIETLGKLIEAKTRFKKGLMQKLLTGKVRFKEFRGENWKEICVKDACVLGRGRVISQKDIISNSGDYPVYSSQTANKGILGFLNSYDFEGDYVTWTTDGAHAGTVFYREGRFNCTNVCGTINNKTKDIDLRYLAYKLGTVAKKYVSYVGNPKLMNNVMGQIKIRLPENVKEQTLIATVLFLIDEEVDILTTMLEVVSNQKKGLMQKLLTGNIRVKI